MKENSKLEIRVRHSIIRVRHTLTLNDELGYLEL